MKKPDVLLSEIKEQLTQKLLWILSGKSASVIIVNCICATLETNNLTGVPTVTKKGGAKRRVN